MLFGIATIILFPNVLKGATEAATSGIRAGYTREAGKDGASEKLFSGTQQMAGQGAVDRGGSPPQTCSDDSGSSEYARSGQRSYQLITLALVSAHGECILPMGRLKKPRSLRAVVFFCLPCTTSG